MWVCTDLNRATRGSVQRMNEMTVQLLRSDLSHQSTMLDYQHATLHEHVRTLPKPRPRSRCGRITALPSQSYALPRTAVQRYRPSVGHLYIFQGRLHTTRLSVRSRFCPDGHRPEHAGCETLFQCTRKQRLSLPVCRRTWTLLMPNCIHAEGFSLTSVSDSLSSIPQARQAGLGRKSVFFD